VKNPGTATPKKRARSRKGAPGILEVALRSGVSGATVSRCFNRPELVKGPTRARIEQAARELGYIRDRVAGTLHGGSSGSVGLVVPTINNAIFSQLIEAFSQHLHEHERIMIIASHGYQLDREVDIVRSLLERRIDALALIGRDHNPIVHEMLKTRSIPVVALWSSRGQPNMPSIGTDHVDAGRKVCQHLIDLGHRDFALLLPDTDQNDRARDRHLGIHQALDAAGIDLPANRVINCDYSIPQAKALTEKLLSKQLNVTSAHGLASMANKIPTAILCANDVIAHGVLYAAQKLGIRVPEQLSVVGIGDFAGSDSIEPELTTVRVPARRIGQLAARALIKSIESPVEQRRIRSEQIEVELVVRGSTAVAAHRA